MNDLISLKYLQDMSYVMEIQGAEGTLFSSEYNLGLYNGLEMAMAIYGNREANFKIWPQDRIDPLPTQAMKTILDICLNALSEAAEFEDKDDCNGSAGEIAADALKDIRQLDPLILMRPVKGEANG